jgi:preprotein translocase subunit SecD
MQIRHRPIYALLGLLLAGWLSGAGCAWPRPTGLLSLLGRQDTAHVVLQVDLDETPVPERAAMLRQVVQIEQRRLTDAGLDVRSIQAEEPNRVHVELGRLDDLEWVTHLLVTPGRLEFREEIAQPGGAVAWMIASAPGDDGVEKGLSGQYFVSAEVGFEPNSNRPLILVEFNGEGGRMLAVITQRLINKPLGIFLDDELLTAPIVREPITGGRSQITGQFTITQARGLVIQLNSGALPVVVQLVGD